MSVLNATVQMRNNDKDWKIAEVKLLSQNSDTNTEYW